MRFNFEGVEFGTSSTDPLILTSFQRSSPDLRSDDVERPLSDGVYVGRDYLGASTWDFEIATNRRDLNGALESSAALESAWRGYGRTTPGLTVPLRLEVDGRSRVVYGRPTEYTGPTPDALARAGAGRITCQFRVTDPLIYSQDGTEVTLNIVPGTVGGLEAPLVAPLTVVSAGEPQQRLLTVDGDAPAPLSVTFYGPVLNPKITVNGQEVGLTGSLAYDESVTIDGRTQRVVNNFGVSRAGRLTRHTRLGFLTVEPGVHEISFSGTDLTGTAKVTVSARSASYSL